MTRDLPLVGVSLSPYVQPNTDWYARSVLKSNANTPTSTAPSSLFQSIGNRTYSFKSKRGRTYDLGRTEAGTLDLQVNNSDGALNPLVSANNLYPYCPVRVTCAYPTTGNILNDTNLGALKSTFGTVTAATGSGTSVVYTCNNTFQIGQQVSVTGLTVGALNLTAQIITAVTATTFTVANAATGTATSQKGTASLDLPATFLDNAVSVCANDSNFELGKLSNWYGSGVSVTTTPRTGTYCMDIAAGYTAWLDVPCVAGQTVTFSIYVKTDLNNQLTGKMTIYPDGYIDATHGSPTTTSFNVTTSYGRRTVTAVANGPKITLSIEAISAIGLDLYVDDIQVEFGSTATTISTTGSTIYNLFNGFVERFPQSYQAPNRGEVNLVATDAVALMSQNTLVNPYAALALQDADTYLYFPFNEEANLSFDVYSATATATDITYQSLNSFVVGDWVTVTGMGVNSMNQVQVIATNGSTFTVSSASGSGTTYGAGLAVATRCYSQSGNAYANTTANGFTTSGGAITLGETNNLAGFNGETNIKFEVTSSSELAEVFVSTPAGVRTAVGTNFCLDVWVKWSTAGRFLVLTHADGTNTAVSVTSGGFLSVTRSGAGGGTATQSSSFNKFQQNVWRLVRVYYDGTNLKMGMADYDAATATSIYNFTFSTLAVPASNVNGITLGSNASGFDGWCMGLRYGKYNALNQGSSISKNLFQVGYTGYFGATTGSRFADIMQNYSGFNYTPIAADLGLNHSGAMVLKDRTLQDVVQMASDTEQGYWYVDGSGFVTFKDQTHRKYTTPNLTAVQFSDNGSGNAYQGESLVINYDLTYVYNQVTVTCSGANFYAEDATSINRYFPRTLSITTENAYFDEVTNLASNLLTKYKDPEARIESITFTPARNPAIWAAMLNLEVGDYVQVTRTPLGASSTTFYGWVEQIEHEFDAQSADWLVHVNVSPHLPIA